jgi:oxaloacetate decarboxylase beta subunit
MEMEYDYIVLEKEEGMFYAFYSFPVKPLFNLYQKEGWDVACRELLKHLPDQKKESGVVDRLSDTMQNALINIVTIMLGLSVGSKLACEKFLSGTTLGILALGLCAFCVGTAAGVLMAKLMNIFSKEKVNPLIGSAGVSAVPMAARVSNKVSLGNDPTNFVLMQAMGPNVSGVIGSAVVAGVLYTLCR